MSDVIGSISVLDGLLKNVYLEPLHEDVVNKFLPLKRLQNKSKDVSFFGRKAIFAVHNKGFGSVVSIADDTGSTPDTSAQKDTQLEEGMKYHVATAAWTEGLMRATKSTIGSFANALKRDLIDLRTAMIASIARQMFGSGDSVVALLTSACDGASPTLLTSDARSFRPGQRIDVVTAAYASRLTVGSFLVVESVDLIDGKVYTSGGTTAATAVGDYVIQYGSNSGTTSYEMKGFGTIMSRTAALHNVTPTVSGSEFWRAQVMSNGGHSRPLTLRMVRQMLNILDIVDAENKIAYMSHNIYENLIDLVQQRQRYGSEVEIDPGMKIQAITGPRGQVGLFPDRHVPAGRIILPDERHLGWVELGGGPEWFMNGSSTLHPIAGKLQQKSIMMWFANMICFLRSKQGQIEDIEESFL